MQLPDNSELRVLVNEFRGSGWASLIGVQIIVCKGCEVLCAGWVRTA